MNNPFQPFSFLVTTSIVSLAVIYPHSVKAAVMIYEFEVSIDSGSLVGETYAGSLEFDESNLSISQFSFDFEGINYTEADLIDPEVFLDNGQFLGLIADVIDTNVEFSFLEAVPAINEPATFLYLINGQEAAGDITYNAVPEPLTILGTMTALGFGGFFKRQLKSSSKPSNS